MNVYRQNDDKLRARKAVKVKRVKCRFEYYDMYFRSIYWVFGERAFGVFNIIFMVCWLFQLSYKHVD